MTVEELYLYMKSKGLENSKIEIQHGDDGGDYYGTRNLEKEGITIHEDENVIIL